MIYYQKLHQRKYLSRIDAVFPSSSLDRSKYIRINFIGAINIEANKCEEVVSFDLKVLLGQIGHWYQI